QSRPPQPPASEDRQSKACPSTLASSPASTVNQKRPDLGIPNRFDFTSSRSRKNLLQRANEARRFRVSPFRSRSGLKGDPRIARMARSKSRRGSLQDQIRFRCPPPQALNAVVC